MFGVRMGKAAVFPAEVCKMRAGQLFKRRLNEDQQRKFMDAATQKPFERLNGITGAVSGDVSKFCSCG